MTAEIIRLHFIPEAEPEPVITARMVLADLCKVDYETVDEFLLRLQMQGFVVVPLDVNKP